MIDGGIRKGSQGWRQGARSPGSAASRPKASGERCPVCAQVHGVRRAFFIPVQCHDRVMAVWRGRLSDAQGLRDIWREFPGLEGKHWPAIWELLNKPLP